MPAGLISKARSRKEHLFRGGVGQSRRSQGDSTEGRLGRSGGPVEMGAR